MIDLGRVRRELPRVFESLFSLGIQDGLSRVPQPGEAPHIWIGSPVGGITPPDLVGSAIEDEARDLGNQTKLAQPTGVRRRHLFVVFDSSSGSAFNAVQRGLIGRLPALPPPITTAWAAAGGHVLMTTPPEAWEKYELPRAVFDDPARWLV